MKKILAICLCVILLLATFPVMAISAEAMPIFVVSTDVSEAMPGEEIKVTLSIKNNPGVCSFKLAVGYDAEILEVVANEKGAPVATKGEVYIPLYYSPTTNNPFIVNWIDTLNGNYTDNGKIVTLTFKILETAAQGNTEISLTYNKNDVYDENFDSVFFETESAYLYVKNSNGDVQTDDELVEDSEKDEADENSQKIDANTSQETVDNPANSEPQNDTNSDGMSENQSTEEIVDTDELQKIVDKVGMQDEIDSKDVQEIVDRGVLNEIINGDDLEAIKGGEKIEDVLSDEEIKNILNDDKIKDIIESDEVSNSNDSINSSEAIDADTNLTDDGGDNGSILWVTVIAAAVILGAAIVVIVIKGKKAEADE